MLVQADSRFIPLKDECVQCIVTSPPYYNLRSYATGKWVGGNQNCSHESTKVKSRIDYPLAQKQSTNNGAVWDHHTNHCIDCGADYVDHQIGQEESLQEYIDNLVVVFKELRRVLKPDGLVFLNLGDSYAGSNKGYNGNGTWSYGDNTKQTTNKGSLGLKPTKTKEFGLKPKDRMLVPHRAAIALQEDGWWVRNDICWVKLNPLPDSVQDRFTTCHESIFMLSKNSSYYFDRHAIFEPIAEASIKRIQQANFDNQIGGPKDYGPGSNRSARKSLENFKKPVERNNPGLSHRKPPDQLEDNPQAALKQLRGRNHRDVFISTVQNYKGAHSAVMSTEVIEPCILAGSRPGDLILDPFGGSGSTAVIAKKLGRKFINIDLSWEYLMLARDRIYPHSIGGRRF